MRWDVSACCPVDGIASRVSEAPVARSRSDAMGGDARGGGGNVAGGGGDAASTPWLGAIELLGSADELGDGKLERGEGGGCDEEEAAVSVAPDAVSSMRRWLSSMRRSEKTAVARSRSQ